MGGPNDERLISLNEIAMDCFNVGTFALNATQPEICVVVKPTDIARALDGIRHRTHRRFSIDTRWKVSLLMFRHACRVARFVWWTHTGRNQWSATR
jgi:hypothetical protein